MLEVLGGYICRLQVKISYAYSQHTVPGLR